jgi:hypothetical protein
MKTTTVDLSGQDDGLDEEAGTNQWRRFVSTTTRVRRGSTLWCRTKPVKKGWRAREKKKKTKKKNVVEVPENYCPGEASASKSGEEDKEDSEQ